MQDVKRNVLRRNIKWNIKWHNKAGWITAVLLLITTMTGIFLRPPLLAFIGNAKVCRIPYTELDTPNPWFDILRRMIYLPEQKMFILATSEGFYYSQDQFGSSLQKFTYQPPASIMGVTVLERYDKNTMLVGSFQGLFLWNYQTGEVLDYINKIPYIPVSAHGAPIGEFKISGFTKDFPVDEIVFDYDLGAFNLNTDRSFPAMPEEVIKNSPVSLWNLALEIHTARIYQPVLGNFYVLVVPLTGLMTLFIIVSGFIVWYKSHRKK